MTRTGRRVARGTITLVLSAALLWTTSNAALAKDWSLTHKKFSAKSKLSLVGSAKISKKVLRLTDASGDAEAGAAWAVPSVDPAQSFSTDFTANLWGAQGCSADGLSFTIQSQGPDAIGRYGEGIGYEGISPALSVEFDDFQNAWDPDNNHVAIALNGDVKNPIATPQTLPFGLYGGGPFHVHITYEAPFDSGVTHPTIKVWVWQDGKMPAAPTTQATLDDALGTLLQGNPAYVGFTAATAACNEKADVTNWTFRPLSRNQIHSDGAINIYWTSPLSPVEGIQQSVSVKKTAPNTYFALNWSWSGSDDGGYMGVQNNGRLFNGKKTKIALFSVWNALDSQGAGCGKFTGEGDGLSCRVPYNFKAGHTYVYAVSRVSSRQPGVWWTASIRDISAKKSTVIGTLRAPDNSGAESINPRLNNFSEYFGDTRLCDKVPTSDVTFRQPIVSGVKADALANFDASSWTRGACTGGSVTQRGSDVRVRLGGMR